MDTPSPSDRSVSSPQSRRPLKTRQARWAQGAARWLAQRGVSPNSISLTSVFFAVLAGACLIAARDATPAAKVALLVAAAALIQLRLLCNLLDGMVAVEFGKKTRAGEIYNDLPDRISDPLTLVPAGYLSHWVSWGSELGWAAGLLAVMTAYVRLLGASVGSPHYFLGPMAKQQRMALMTAACLLSAAEAAMGWHSRAMVAALIIVVLGSLHTMWRRVERIRRDLESR